MMKETDTTTNLSHINHQQLASSRKGLSKRVLLGAAPAAAITFGLFIGMNAMIGVDAEPTEDIIAIASMKITPDIAETDNTFDSREPVKQLPEVTPPPDLPAHTIHKVPNFIPVGENIGKAPERIERTGADLFVVKALNIPRKAMLIGGLNVTYPSSMIAKEIEGSCEVRFDLNTLGEAYNIRPACTHAGFERSAKRAVSGARFSASVADGKPTSQANMIFPIEFRLDSD